MSVMDTQLWCRWVDAILALVWVILKTIALFFDHLVQYVEAVMARREGEYAGEPPERVHVVRTATVGEDQHCSSATTGKMGN